MSSVSRIPQAKSFCFCLSLETGCKVIGFIELIICAIFFVFLTYFTVQITQQYQNQNPHKDLIIAAIVYIDLCMLFEVILAIYLLFGVYKSRKNYIRTWVLIQFAFFVLAVFSNIFSIILAAANSYETTGLHIFEEVIGLVLHVYSLWVVHSYYVSISGREALFDAA